MSDTDTITDSQAEAQRERDRLFDMAQRAVTTPPTPAPKPAPPASKPLKTVDDAIDQFVKRAVIKSISNSKLVETLADNFSQFAENARKELEAAWTAHIETFNEQCIQFRKDVRTEIDGLKAEIAELKKQKKKGWLG